MFKYHHKLLPSIFNDFFTSIQFSYSNNKYLNCYQLPMVRTNYLKFSIKFYGPQIWNSIPNDLKTLNLFSKFKKDSKKYILVNNINTV